MKGTCSTVEFTPDIHHLRAQCRDLDTVILSVLDFCYFGGEVVSMLNSGKGTTTTKRIRKVTGI